MANKFNPVRVELSRWGGNRTEIHCVCGGRTEYNTNQKKRIADEVAFHKQNCTKAGLLKVLAERIERHEREIEEEKATIANINAGKYGI